MEDVVKINWARVSAQEQNHQLCRYCDEPATHMRKHGKHYTIVCEKHRKHDQDNASKEAL